jgi:CubicO group peptidase (beta-lactamase class C family)
MSRLAGLRTRTWLRFFNVTLLCGHFVAACTSGTWTPPGEQTVAPTTIPSPTGTAPASAAAEATEEISIPAARIDERMNTLVERIPLAGLALGIHFNGEVYERGYGLANTESGTPVTETTVFKIASLTKSFTAAAILRLAEEGKLSLDDPLTRFLPQIPVYAQGILVRQLLNHTSGLPEWSVDEAQEALPEGFSTAQAVDYYFHTTAQLEFEPGESWSYTNVGYFMLGAIIEHVSGMPYDGYLRETFFEPLGLHSTHDCSSRSDALPAGYHSRQTGLEMARSSDLRFLGAAGALCSTTGDLLRWLHALRNGTAVGPESWEQMITRDRLPGGEALEYGFGFVVQQADQGLLIMHEGATAGFNSYFAYYPDHDLSLVLLTNTDGFDPDLQSIASLLADMLVRE